MRGVPFEWAADFAWDGSLIVEDLRKDYGERRFQALGLIGDRLHMMVFTPRARKAHDVLLEIFGAASAAKMLKPRGRPKSGRARISISIRLPPETLARWKATGPGWQTRMAEALSRVV